MKKDIKEAWRFEYKYKLPLNLYYQFRSAIIPYMEHDDFSRKALRNSYLVRSLYYDTYYYKSYYEKMEGTYGRTKYRLRTYAESAENEPDVRAELKVRKGQVLEKHSAFVPYRHYLGFMENRNWPDRSSPVLTEFERQVHLHALRPKVLVEYYREAFRSREGSDMRISFDLQVSSCIADTLFPKTPFFRQHHPNNAILEIKCHIHRPAWLGKLISRYGLMYVANSKYTQGIEASRPDLITPYKQI